MINTIFLNRLDDFKNQLSPSVRLGEILENVFIVLFNKNKKIAKIHWLEVSECSQKAESGSLIKSMPLYL